METAHKRPNYILIWVYLALLTAAELGLAFRLPISPNLKLALLLFLAVWKALLVTALVAAGTNAFNQWRERDVDARMHRTRGRPLPSGRITPRAAAAFAGIISVAGVAYLAFAVNLLTAGLAALTLASYVLLYTPLNRTTTLTTLIGAVPGALPIVGGWTAAGGNLGPAVATLFWILFLWPLAHFLPPAWIYRGDICRGRVSLLSAA